MTDKRLLWDLIKREIQIQTVQFSKSKAKTKRELESKILERCDELYVKLCEGRINEEEQKEYDQKQAIT